MAEINIDDLRARARRRLPQAVFDFVDGEAEDADVGNVGFRRPPRKQTG